MKWPNWSLPSRKLRSFGGFSPSYGNRRVAGSDRVRRRKPLWRNHGRSRLPSGEAIMWRRIGYAGCIIPSGCEPESLRRNWLSRISGKSPSGPLAAVPSSRVARPRRCGSALRLGAPSSLWVGLFYICCFRYGFTRFGIPPRGSFHRLSPRAKPWAPPPENTERILQLSPGLSGHSLGCWGSVHRVASSPVLANIWPGIE